MKVNINLIYSHKKHCMMNKYLFWLVELICITKHFNNIWWKNYDKKNTDLRKFYWSWKVSLKDIKDNLIDSDNNMYVTDDSLIEINNIITDLNNILLRKFNDKIHTNKQLINDKMYDSIQQKKS